MNVKEVHNDQGSR